MPPGKKGGKSIKGGKGGKGSKGGKVSKGKNRGKGARGGSEAGQPRRLKRGDDVSLTSDEGSDDGQVIEDDESIDDEMAFGSSDEELQKMFESVKSKKPKAAAKGKGKGKADAADEEERIYASDETVDEDDESSSEGGNENTINLSDLLDDSEKAKKPSRAAPAVVETKAEGEFEASSLRTVTTPSLSDLIASLGTTDRDVKSSRRLQKSLSKLSKDTGDSKLISTPEEAVERDARERELTKAGVKQDLDTWNNTVRHARVKEFQSFPLPEPNPIPKPSTSMAGVTAKASTDMEKEIAGLLQGAGLRSDKPEEEVTTADFVKLQNDVFGLVEKDTEASNMTVSKLKSVMSYEHEKKKRVKKIKSKIYRRMLRKEKEKSREKKLELLALVDPEAALKKKKEEMLKMRAQERMNVRQKNKSQWIKSMKAMAKWNPTAQTALANQGRTHQNLMKKMDETVEDAGYNKTGSDSDAGYSSDTDNAEMQEIDTLVDGGSKAPLWKLREQVGQKDPSAKKKGLWGMKFMQRSEDKDKEDLLREIDDLEDEVDRFTGEKAADSVADTGAEADADGEGEGVPKSVKKVKKIGRVRFGGVDASPSVPQQQPPRSALANGSVKNAGAAAVTDDFVGEDASVRHAADAEEDVPAKGSAKAKKRVRVVEPSAAVQEQVQLQDSDDEVRELLKPKKRRVIKRVVRKRKAASDPEAEAGAEAETTAEPEPTPAQPKKRAKKKAKDGKLETTDGLTMDQDYLISRAFAADTLASEFQKEKDAEADKDVEGIDTNQALPGWGEWGGEDETLNEQAKKRKAKLEAERAVKVEAARAKRKDAKLKNVIINEDADAIDPKYTLNKIPFPFRSSAQFESTMEMPVGPDWNTESKTRQHVRPATKTTRGATITPLEREQGSRKAPKTKRRKTAVKKSPA
eukprot:TRINITY_DN13784_c0_g1_i2.p1 TRINITY_DN13784_c0_g1~~TRINITY_DN13784_c0_g1_i2.p1  ORF type:complete len:935 (+),score=448.75 TRINITY_DN13784_c0_g1_i2:55-2805(+)